MKILLSLLIGFAFGGLPFAVLFSDLFSQKNILREGSGNPGTTNVLRVVGALPAALTFLFDCAKTVAAVLLSSLFFGRSTAVYAGVGAVFGHVFSPFLGFRGGKGVAATIALALVTDWRLLAALIPAAVAAGVTGKMAVGSVAFACVLPFACAVFGAGWQYTVAFSLLGLLMLVRHRSNFDTCRNRIDIS